jgi:hypothetical protein
MTGREGAGDKALFRVKTRGRGAQESRGLKAEDAGEASGLALISRSPFL